MNPRFVWPAVALAGLGMVVAAAMAMARVPADTIVLIVSIMVTPVLTAFIAGQIAEVRGTTQQVQQQTNGNVTRMLDIMESQSRMLHLSAPGDASAPEAKQEDPAAPDARAA